MNKELFEILLARSLNGTATIEERDLLDEYLTRMSSKDPGELNPAEIEVITGKLFNKLQENLAHEQVGPERRIGRRWLKPVTAAAALLLVVLCSWWVYRQVTGTVQHDRVIAQVPTLVNDLTPGGDRAILTLSDGSRIELTEDRNGVIGNEGSATISQGGNMLVYKALQQQQPSAMIAYNTMATPKGGQYQLHLADGTKVWLNSLSSIKFPTSFTAARERRITITGEAYLEVARDPSRPFHVEVNGMDVAVLGTKFNINAYQDEPQLTTTLVEGAVRLYYSGGMKTLAPGDQARVAGNAIKVESDADIDQALAWKNGMFYLNGTNIQEIMRQVSRWYDAEIIYEDDAKDMDFFGVISRRQNVSELLKVIEKTGVVHFEVTGKKIYVSR